jgi:hypothetical protein
MTNRAENTTTDTINFKQALAVTEQRMGFRGAVRVFEIARDSSKSESVFPPLVLSSSRSELIVFFSSTPFSPF